MSTPWALQISAGRGPVEVRRFVAELAPALAIRLEALQIEVIDWTLHGDPEAPGSIHLALDGPISPAQPLLGTHVLVAPCRGRRARRRWFVGVTRHALPSGEPPALELDEVSLSAVRARGPGGQHVNTRSTAVRAVHRPTRIAVRAEGQRSQAANRAVALARLAKAVAEAHRRDQEPGQQARWLAHTRVVRGEPVVSWRRGHRGTLIEIRQGS